VTMSYPQVIVNSPVLNFSGGGAAYSVNSTEIFMSDEDRNSIVLHKFLHELGHHIWYSGKVDTVAYKEYYKSSENIWEDFANDHYFYFMGWLNKKQLNYRIFLEFYNKAKLEDGGS